MTTEEPEPSRRGIRRVRAVALVLLLIVLYLLATFADIWVATRRTAEGPAQAALVLGAAQYNGTPSPVLVRRLERALELYRSKQVALVVVSGGKQPGDTTTEAKAGYDFLRRSGVPDDDLRLEVNGDSTYTSMAAATRFLRGEGIQSVILVTDAYHARRVELIAEELALDAEVAAVGSADLGPMVRETIAVSVGRAISFRRLDNLQD